MTIVSISFWGSHVLPQRGGPVREQPHRVLAEPRLWRVTAPRQTGQPRSRLPARGWLRVHTRERRDFGAVDGIGRVSCALLAKCVRPAALAVA